MLDVPFCWAPSADHVPPLPLAPLQVISQKYQKKQMRKNNLRSAKVQKIPGFGQKKGKYRGKGTVPHWMK